MKYLRGLSMFFSYIIAYGGVSSIHEWVTAGEIYAMIFALILFFISATLTYVANKKVSLDPIAFIFILRGIVSLSVFITVPSPTILINSAGYILVGVVLLILPSILFKTITKNDNKLNNEFESHAAGDHDKVNDLVSSGGINTIEDELKEENYKNNVLLENPPRMNIEENELIKLSTPKQSSFFRRLLLGIITTVSYVILFIVATNLIAELFFPNYLGDGEFSFLIIYLPIGLLTRYVTLLNYNIKERIIIVSKNVLSFIWFSSFQVFLNIYGFLIFIVSLYLLILFDLKSPNSKIDWLKNGVFLKSPKKVLLVLIGFPLIYYSLRMGLYNLGMESSLSQLEVASGSPVSNFSRTENDLSVVDRRNQTAILDPQERLKEQQEKYDRYMGNPIDAKKTIKGIQNGLNELGYYKGSIDGSYGPLTKEAIKNYRIDNYDANSGHSIEVYAHDRISLSLIEELGIPEP